MPYSREHTIADVFPDARAIVRASRKWQGISLEDREDALQQAAVELWTKTYPSARYAKTDLLGRWENRLKDLCKRRGGRSRDAFYRAGPPDGLELRPAKDDVYELVAQRETLRLAVSVLDSRQQSALREPAIEPTSRKRRYRARNAIRSAVA